MAPIKSADSAAQTTGLAEVKAKGTIGPGSTGFANAKITSFLGVQDKPPMGTTNRASAGKSAGSDEGGDLQGCRVGKVPARTERDSASEKENGGNVRLTRLIRDSKGGRVEIKWVDKDSVAAGKQSLPRSKEKGVATRPSDHKAGSPLTPTPRNGADAAKVAPAAATMSEQKLRTMSGTVTDRPWLKLDSKKSRREQLAEDKDAKVAARKSLPNQVMCASGN